MHATVAPAATSAQLRRFAACAALSLLIAGVATPAGAHAAVRAGSLPATARTAVFAALPAAVTPAPTLVASPACAPAGADVACDLWAKPGTLALSGATVPIWGFAATDAAPAGTPGPVLQATAGQTVTVTVHNALTQPLALAIPGVHMGAGGAVAPDDTTGAAAGATKAYTFTAPAAGTYLYEAGHTVQGPRQVAMGLAGALVVRPAGFDPTAPTQDGTATTGFEDEAVLVLSEVDPAFNANPTTYDLRNFHPKYRLINGHAFPSTDPIGTDHGRRTVLRYVNAGVVGHAMGVLGTKQEVLAINGHADVTRSALVADMIAAGQTEDVRVNFPAGGADKLPVYEMAGTLDNAGQVAAVGSRVVGFGGMLTFLQAGATVSAGDTVGPTTSAIAVAPNPATPTGATVTATVSDAATGNSVIDRAELFVDGAAVVVGGGTAMTAADLAFDSPTEAVTGAIPLTVLANLTQGTHTVYVRGMDHAGNWGPALSFSFTMASTGPTTSGLTLSPNPTNGDTPVQISATGDDSSIGGQVTAGEYFIDPAGVPTSGSGSALTVTSPATVATGTATISTATLAGFIGSGSHSVQVHFRDTQGLWGPLSSISLRLDRAAPALGLTGNQITPNPTNGVTGDPVDPSALKVHVSLVDPVDNAISSPVVAAEGFLSDVGPGTSGTGVVFLADDGSWNSTSESGYGLIPLSQLVGLSAGQHTVWVHGKDAAGNWGTAAQLTFVLDRGPSVTAAAPGTVSTLAGPTVMGTANALAGFGYTVTAAEYFEGTDPGAGNGSALAISPIGSASTTLRIEPRSLSVGSHVLLVRAKDSNGIWGKTTLVPITVTGLFSNGFEAGNTTGWSSSTLSGTSLITKLAAIDGSYGMQVTASGRYVQRNVTATSLHAAFKLNTSTLATTSAGVTVLQARVGTGATGAQVLAVQYRVNAGLRQVRLVTSSVTGSAWVTVGAGISDLRVDRTATGAVTLSINGGATLEGPFASSGTIGSIRLGVVSGSVSSGNLQLDSFGATN